METRNLPRLKIHLNELTEEQQWAGYLHEIAPRLNDLKGPSLSKPMSFCSSKMGRESASTFHQTRLRPQTRPVSSIFSWTSKASWISFFLLNHEDSDPSLGAHSTANTQRQSLVPHTPTAITETGTGLTTQSCSPELEARYAESQTNADLWAPSEWLASPMGTYKEIPAFHRAA